MESNSATDDKAIATPYDPAQAVPGEYDVLCDECGYSLVGIQSDKCPECGHPFDTNQLPFARVPWLHRRRIGTFKAFAATCWMVLRRSRAFAQELCRPVRISAADARAFRLRAIWIATLYAAVVALTMTTYDAYAVFSNATHFFRPATFRYYAIEVGIFALFGVVWVMSAHLYFRLMTDLPLFIWKGHPSLKAADLAPIQCYAAAPLVLLAAAPIPVVLACVGAASDNVPLMNRSMFLFLGFALLWFLILLASTVQLMLGAGVERRRVVWMVVYMPVHYLMMAFISLGFGTIVCGILLMVLKAMHLRTGRALLW